MAKLPIFADGRMLAIVHGRTLPAPASPGWGGVADTLYTSPALLSALTSGEWGVLRPRVWRVNDTTTHLAAIGFKDITDGTSTTVLVGENSLQGDSGFTQGPGVSHLGETMGVEDTLKVWPSDAEGRNQARMRPGSDLGGAQHLFADGSVRYLGNSTDASVLLRITTPAGGEVVSLE